MATVYGASGMKKDRRNLDHAFYLVGTSYTHGFLSKKELAYLFICPPRYVCLQPPLIVSAIQSTAALLPVIFLVYRRPPAIDQHHCCHLGRQLSTHASRPSAQTPFFLVSCENLFSIIFRFNLASRPLFVVPPFSTPMMMMMTTTTTTTVQ